MVDEKYYHLSKYFTFTKLLFVFKSQIAMPLKAWQLNNIKPHFLF